MDELKKEKLIMESMGALSKAVEEMASIVCTLGKSLAELRKEFKEHLEFDREQIVVLGEVTEKIKEMEQSSGLGMVS